MRTLGLMLMVTLNAGLLGCGQKGPLVLPDAQRPHKQISIPHSRADKPPSIVPAAPTTPPSSPAPAGPGATSAPASQDGNQANPNAAPH